jgi:hypothetical protein
MLLRILALYVIEAFAISPSRVDDAMLELERKSYLLEENSGICLVTYASDPRTEDIVTCYTQLQGINVILWSIILIGLAARCGK